MLCLLAERKQTGGHQSLSRLFSGSRVCRGRRGHSSELTSRQTAAVVSTTQFAGIPSYQLARVLSPPSFRVRHGCVFRNKIPHTGRCCRTAPLNQACFARMLTDRPDQWYAAASMLFLKTITGRRFRTATAETGTCRNVRPPLLLPLLCFVQGFVYCPVMPAVATFP